MFAPCFSFFTEIVNKEENKKKLSKRRRRKVSLISLSQSLCVCVFIINSIRKFYGKKNKNYFSSHIK